MAKFSVTLQDSAGNAQTGKDVDLYEGDGNGTSKYADMIDTDNDGVYTCGVSNSGTYTVKVEGTIISELQSFFIPAEDIEDHISASNPHSGSASNSDLDTIKGAGWTSETIKDNADDIEAIKGSGWTVETIKDNADDIDAIKGSGWNTAMTIKGHNDLIGDLDFEATVFLTSITNITNALRELDKQITNMALGKVPNIYGTRHLATHFHQAAASAGSQADEPIEFEENSNTYKQKVIVRAYELTKAATVHAKVLVGNGNGNVRLGIYIPVRILQESVEAEITSTLNSVELLIPVSNWADSAYISLDIKADAGETVKLYNYEIYITDY